MAIDVVPVYVVWTRKPKMPIVHVTYWPFMISIIGTGAFTTLFGWLLPNLFISIFIAAVLVVACSIIELFDDWAFRLIFLWFITVGRCPLRVRLLWGGDTRAPLMPQLIEL